MLIGSDIRGKMVASNIGHSIYSLFWWLIEKNHGKWEVLFTAEIKYILYGWTLNCEVNVALTPLKRQEHWSLALPPHPIQLPKVIFSLLWFKINSLGQLSFLTVRQVSRAAPRAFTPSRCSFLPDPILQKSSLFCILCFTLWFPSRSKRTRVKQQ